jgi:hypothetical protein
VSESFWASIPCTEVPLSANVPNGGHTPYILVKMANNGTYLFVLLSWNVTVPSHMMSSVFSLEEVLLVIRLYGITRARDSIYRLPHVVLKKQSLNHTK